MTKGRKTSVLSVRLPDEVVSRLKKMAKKRKQTMTELLKPVIGNFAVRGYVLGTTYVIDNSSGAEHSQRVKKVTEAVQGQDIDEIEDPPNLEKYPDYWRTPRLENTDPKI